jgi:phosphonate transport system substrate-binding protein
MTRFGDQRVLAMAATCQVFALLLCVGVVQADTSRQPLTLGVHPYLGYAQLQLRFRPLAEYIAERIGQPVIVRVGRNYDEHIRETGRDLLDIAYMGPVSYVKLTEAYGEKPILAGLERNGTTRLRGDIIVAADSGIETMADLRGKRFGFGDPDSTMSSIVPIAHLAHAGISLEDLAYHGHYKGHTNVAMAVLSGRVDAGAVKNEVFLSFRDQGLRSISKLPEVSEHLFVSRSDLPPDLLERLREVLVQAHYNDAGRQAIMSIHRQATRLVPMTDNDYDDLRTILRIDNDPATSRH